MENKQPRSNKVFHESPIKKNLVDYKYDTVYFGTPNKQSMTMKLDDVLFLTPLKGIASIFAVRPQSTRKYIIDPPRELHVNRGFKEWGKNSTDYLKEVHVLLRGIGMDIEVKDTVEDATGYVYELKLTPELKKHIWWGNKMQSPDMEVVLKDVDEITFDNEKKLDIKMYISKDPRPPMVVNESYMPDATSGTSDFDEKDDDPDDCYCESFFQEASHKTKLNRDKNKIKDDLKYNKSTGVGELHDSSSGISVPVDLTFDNKRQTSTGYLTYKNGRRAVGMNINPNDLNRGHGFTKYLHEKNHILQDLRKRNDGNDNNDLSMISAFISKHSNEIKTSHSADKDEYLADLNVARTRGYDKTIRMLQDMMIKPLKSSPSAKHSKSFINKSANNKVDNELSGEFLNELYEEYNKMLDDEKLLLTTMKASRNVGEHHYKSLEKRIKKMESDTSSKEHFMKVARQASFIQEVNKGIDEHNSDLKLRIQFLRDMKKIDSTNNDIKYKKEKSFTESGEPILSLLNTINNRTYDNTSKLQSKIDEFIIEHFGTIDNNDFVNGMILSYVILEYVEEIIHNEGDDIMESTYTPLSEFDHYFQEAKMKAKTRKELDDFDFALVYKDASGNKIRKYPINDEAHVKAAARMFPRGVPYKYRKEVAGKILRRAHKFGIDTSGWKSLNAANEKD